MEVLHEICCGLDVHKKSVTACLRKGRRSEVRSFGTFTSDLLELYDWLTANGCTDVAMESTGVYWKPIYNILESGFKLMLVNAKHVKNVPGRKTDEKDSEWIAKLLQHGLLNPSFVPNTQIQELRDLTRYRTKLVQERVSAVNRIHKVLESANIKLGSVATDVLGKSGRSMLDAMVDGNTDAEALAQMSCGALRKKISELTQALHGRIQEHHRFLLGELLDQIDHKDASIERVGARIQERMLPFREMIENADTVDGVDVRTAQDVLAEVGPDMKQFPTDNHLLSWAKICPSNNESAGKHGKESIGKGNKWLRGALLQAAWAAVKKKGTYLSALYHRLARRRGKARAIVAIAAKILRILYHIWSNGTTYRDLGADFWDKQNAEQTKKHLMKRLEALGVDTTPIRGSIAG